MLRRKFLLRIKKIKNIHQVNLYDINSLKLIILTTEKIILKKVLKIFSALKLIMLQQPMFLRLKKTQVRLNLKKGSPIGVFISIRNFNKLKFLHFFKWEILPQINKTWKLKNKSNMCFSILIKNIFLFSNLKPFYFFFNNFFKIQIFILFKNLNFQENFFISRYYQLPFEQKNMRTFSF